MQLRFFKRRTLKLRKTERRTLKLGALKRRTLKLCELQRRALKLCELQRRALKLRKIKRRTLKLDALKRRTLKLSARKVYLRHAGEIEDRALKIAAAGAKDVSSPFRLFRILDLEGLIDIQAGQDERAGKWKPAAAGIAVDLRVEHPIVERRFS